ncbi:MAG: TolC family protein [Deltaproteobacteria bacterium]|nr:TolC family protein [Deltaproteobacteria bacterium]
MTRLNKLIFTLAIIILHSATFTSAATAQHQSPTGSDGEAGTDSPAPSLVRSTLTLGDALRMAQTNSPLINAAMHQLQADQAREAAQRDGTPNPALTVEAEDFLGNGVARGANALQVTTAISQEVELGHKAENRKKIRSAHRQVSEVMQTLVLQNALSEVAMAFLNVLAQQERLNHAREMVKLSQQTVNTITAQVEAGRSAGMEQEKAMVELSLTKLNESDAKRALESAKVYLSNTCGADTVFFSNVTGSLDAVSELPVLADLITEMRAHPALMAANARILRQQSLADAEVANRIPNITFELGFRWNNASSNRSMVAGVGIPLPIWDRNRGNIEAAAKEVLRAEDEKEAQKMDLIKEITLSHQSLEYELHRLTILQNEIVPSVTATFTAVEEGYRIGRFGYLDLLDAQRTFFDVNHMVLDALVHYHAARITLNRTVGLAIPENLFQGSKTDKPASDKEKP